MTTSDPVMISAVIMHHPSRADRIPALVAACQPLPVRVVVDPDPDGPRSPLRTAKRAWAAIAPGAAHHVVFTDDLLPAAGMAEHLHRALVARPRDGVSLSVQQTSPRNSYGVRWAALAGRPFVEMSAVEWTPTLALALPVALAEKLARFLAELPDDYVDDDHQVTRFRVEHGIRVVATVPNLVEHADVVSLSPYGDEGRRPVTVYDEHLKIPAGWWASAGDAVVPRSCPRRSQPGGDGGQHRGRDRGRPCGWGGRFTVAAVGQRARSGRRRTGVPQHDHPRPTAPPSGRDGSIRVEPFAAVLKLGSSGSFHEADDNAGHGSR